jgi:hypothetical protein
VFIGTFLATGDAVAFCSECLPQFAVSLAEMTTGIPDGELGKVIENMVKATPEDPAAAGAEATMPPHDASHGAPTDEPPAPAPADTDQEAEGNRPLVGPDDDQIPPSEVPALQQATQELADSPPPDNDQVSEPAQ